MRSFLLCLTLPLFTLFILSSCQRDPAEPLSVFSIDKKDIHVSSTGGQDSVILNSSVDWTLEGLPTWIHCNITSGNPGNSKLVFSIDANEGTQPRTTEITFKGTGVPPITVKITQDGSAPFISVDKTSLQVDPGGQIDSIVITSNTKWNLSTSSSSWIQADRSAGDSGITKVLLTFSPNTTSTTQTGEIVISPALQTAQSVKVTVSQNSFSLSDFLPKKGPYNTSVTLTGSFGTNPKIMLNGIACTIISNTVNEIIFTTPRDGTSGKITVTFDNTTLTTTSDFTVTNTWVKVLDEGYSGLGGIIQDGTHFVWNNKIYFGLGLDQVPPVTINTFGFRIYDPATNQWSQGPAQPSNFGGRTDAACVVLNNLVYLGSGRYYAPYSDFWSFDPMTESWKQLTNYPPPQNTASLYFENKNSIYLGEPRIDTIMKRFDPLANGGNGSWTNVPLRFPRLSHSLCFTIGSYTYIVGGIDSINTLPYLSTTFKFDPVNNSLSRVADLPVNFGVFNGSAGSFVLNGKGYVFSWGNLYRDLYVYDPAINTWTSLGSTLAPDLNKIGNNVTVVNSEIYAWYRDGTVYKYIPL